VAAGAASPDSVWDRAGITTRGFRVSPWLELSLMQRQEMPTARIAPQVGIANPNMVNTIVRVCLAS